MKKNNYLKYWQADAFTSKPFSGNPAAVFVLQEELSRELMQKIAMELNLSETAFTRFNPRKRVWEIKWFTPNSEVDLCGHATLATAHILWSEVFTDNPEIIFASNSGHLKVDRQVYKDDIKYILDFPEQPPQEKDNQQELLKEICNLPIVDLKTNGHDCLLVCENEADLLNYQPNYDLIKQLDERGFIISCAGSEFDYTYRAFFPKLDVPEDPVTGSANTILAPYWAKKLNKSTLSAFQASKRGGELYIEYPDNQRVLIAGKAVTVSESLLKINPADY